MIERTAQKALLRLASQFPVIGITGPRQSGKSTLAKLTFPQKKYVSFDEKSMREMAKSNPKAEKLTVLWRSWLLLLLKKKSLMKRISPF